MQLLMNVADGASLLDRARVGMPPLSYHYLQVDDHKLERELERWIKDRLSAIDQLSALKAFEDVIIRHD